MEITLRPDQQKLITDYRQADGNVILVAPTGFGKTIVMGELARQAGQPTVAIAHRHELVGQISRAVARFGVRHNIIGSKNSVQFCIAQHIRYFGRSFYDPRAPFTVAAVDTLIARSDSLRQWAQTVNLWMIDECFPAGTLVDGKPVESLLVGDTVTAWDEHTGKFASHPVTQRHVSPMPDVMVRIDRLSHHVLYSTLTHPFWTRRGWVNAWELRDTDEVLCLRRGSEPTESVHVTVSQERSAILQQDLFNNLSVESVIGNNGRNQPCSCVQAHDGTQSHGSCGNTSESICDTEGDGAWPEVSRRQRETCNCGRNDADADVRTFGVSGAACSSHRISQGCGCDTLQAGLRPSEVQDCDRSGRQQSSATIAARVGQTQRRFSNWVRLASVSLVKRGDPDFPAGDHVYNIGVDQLHTYTVDGTVVHNCHHVLENNKWGKAVGMFPHAKGVGFTATPIRADRKSLARVQGGVFDDMVIGPTMRELINRGSLCEYRIFAPPQSISREGLAISANGDFAPAALRQAAHKSQIVGDIVKHYLRIAPGKRGITFVVDVEQATEVAEAFRAAGVSAECVSAKTPDAVRDAVMRKFEAGTILQLVNVDLFGEGVDVPAVEVVSMGRPTESYGLYVQQFGRALRTIAGKTHGTIIDHVGNVVRHGLPDAVRKWSLIAEERGRKTQRDPDVMPVTTCVACFRAYEATTATCPHCGYVAEPESRARIEFVDGDLIELDADTLAAMRGAVAEIDMPVPFQAVDARTGAMAKNWLARQEEQTRLRAAIALWAGVRRDLGDDDAAIYRRFYHTFGTDVLTAQTLGAPEARKLKEQIECC